MKKILLILCCLFATAKIQAQEQEIQQLLLNVEKLSQLKQLLSDMKKGYQVVSSGYNSIKDLSQGNFSLHQTFLDGLMQVSPAVRKYRKVADVINYQLALVKEYKSAYNRFRQQGMFQPAELDYMGRVYGNLFNKSLQNLDELTNVVTAGKLRMSDDERIKAIDRIYLDMQDKLLFLRSFNRSTLLLSAQREQEQRDKVNKTHMTKTKMTIILMVTGILLPVLASAQGVADKIGGLNAVLDQLYDEMIPLCSQLISVGQGIAGFGATWYIASRVWKHIANAEPIDFYPLFRPFALGFCIAAFPAVLGLMNGVMKPTVTATAAMVDGSNKTIETLLKHKEEAMKKSKFWKIYVGEDGNGNRDEWYKYTYDEDPSNESLLGKPGNSAMFAMDKMVYNMKNSVKQYLSEILQVLFEAAALCINTLRTFQLVVLAILGPLVFGISVFDGFQHTLTAWIARYLNVFLWLPVANIFGAIIGKVQEKMIVLDIGQIEETGRTVFSSYDTGYIIFMLIGIVGYFTVPSVSNFIVNAGFGGGMQQKVTGMFSGTAHSAQSGAMGVGNIIGNSLTPTQGLYDGTDPKSNGDPASSHQGQKLSGKPS